MKYLLVILSLFLLSGCALAQELDEEKVTDEVKESNYVLRGMVITFNYETPDLNSVFDDENSIYFYFSNEEEMNGVAVSQIKQSRTISSENVHFHFSRTEIGDEMHEQSSVSGDFFLHLGPSHDGRVVTPYYLYKNLETGEFKTEVRTGMHLSGLGGSMALRAEAERTVNDIAVEDIDFNLTIKMIEPLEAVNVIIKDFNHETVSNEVLDLTSLQTLEVDEDHYVIIEEVYASSKVRTLYEEKGFHTFHVLNAHGVANNVNLQITFEQ